jgi:hypothetical protein
MGLRLVEDTIYIFAINPTLRTVLMETLAIALIMELSHMALNRLTQLGQDPQAGIILRLNNTKFIRLLFEDNYSLYMYLYEDSVYDLIFYRNLYKNIFCNLTFAFHNSQSHFLPIAAHSIKFVFNFAVNFL